MYNNQDKAFEAALYFSLGRTEYFYVHQLGNGMFHFSASKSITGAKLVGRVCNGRVC